MVVSYVLFFLAGLGFGYAAHGAWKWLPLAVPLAFALFTAFTEGVNGTFVARVVLALVLTAVGVVLGMLLERRGERSDQAGFA
jgi:hypothetical protein